MNEEEKKAIERINKILEQWQEIVDIEDKDERELEMSAYAEEMPFYEMKILLNLIQKQEKVIDKMAEDIEKTSKYFSSSFPMEKFWLDKGKIKKHFMREVENE